MNATIIKCFVASPDDMSSYRQACNQVFDEVNHRMGDTVHLRIEMVSGEKDAIPGCGANAQSVINEQLAPEKCDWFICIVGSRIGTPTAKAPSGTVEEFNRVITTWRGDKQRNIMVYFQKVCPVSPSEDSVAQMKGVSDFKTQVSQCGCYYKEFNDLQDFKDDLVFAVEKKMGATASATAEENDTIEISRRLDRDLNDALSLFSNQPIQWIDRRLCDECNFPNDLVDSGLPYIYAKDIITGDYSCVIKAQPQCGLTSLGRWLARQAWNDGKKWAVIDCAEIKSRKIPDAIAQAKELFRSDALDCILLDSWSAGMSGARKYLESISTECGASRLILLETTLNRLDTNLTFDYKIDRSLRRFVLLPLTKSDVRKAVSVYGTRLAYDETTVLNKIMSDIEALNIHRSPMNCWTLLTVAERNFQETPINRSQLLDSVLYTLFNLQDLPTYSEKPDVKDCEHLLGYFCDWMIRNSEYEFTQEDFLNKAREYCDSCYVELDYNWLFNTLLDNKILVHTIEGKIRFWTAFWVFYFAAKRMKYDQGFREYVLTDNRYSAYPEIIEFYTGDSRGETAVLKILKDDLVAAKKAMSEKLGFDKPLNPLRMLKWSCKESDAEKMKKNLHDFVQNSNVPDYIKDQHSDEHYNYIKPYDQSIQKYIEGSSFHKFEMEMSALSRALRNSDYADPEVRCAAIRTLIDGWLEIAKILFVLAPALAVQRRAAFSDTLFYLDKGFSGVVDNPKKCLLDILMSVPSNVIREVADDISSQRNGRLFYSLLDSEPNELAQHLIIRYLIQERPKDWNRYVLSYIQKVQPRSFYQDDVVRALRSEFKYGYYDARVGSEIKTLLLESGSRFYSRSTASLQATDFVPKPQVQCDDSPAENVGKK